MSLLFCPTLRCVRAALSVAQGRGSRSEAAKFQGSQPVSGQLSPHNHCIQVGTDANGDKSSRTMSSHQLD